MAQKGIFLACTDTPFTLVLPARRPSTESWRKLQSAWKNGVTITFSTDMDYWKTGNG